jgi:transposase
VDAGEDELLAETVTEASTDKVFERERPPRKPFPAHLPRERVILTTAANCPSCGSAKLTKLGEDITETLGVVPRQ